MSDEERIIEKIQKLIAKAESTEFDEEKRAFLKKADELMQLNMLSEWDLNRKQKAQSVTVMTKEVPVVSFGMKHVTDSFVNLASVVAGHCRCTALFRGIGYGDVSSEVWGRENDLEYFELLYTSLRMQAQRAIDPQFQQDKTIGENIYSMKAAGLTWATIAVRCGYYAYEADFDKKDARWIRWYKEECTRQGSAPIGAQPKNYQLNFMKAFVISLDDRLYQIRRENEKITTQGTMALAIRDNKAEVDSAIKKRYPKMGKVRAVSNGKINGQARMAGAEAGRKADLGVGSRDSVSGSRKALGA